MINLTYGLYVVSISKGHDVLHIRISVLLPIFRFVFDPTDPLIIPNID